VEGEDDQNEKKVEIDKVVHVGSPKKNVEGRGKFNDTLSVK
jgi:hypothetical protein